MYKIINNELYVDDTRIYSETYYHDSFVLHADITMYFFGQLTTVRKLGRPHIPSLVVATGYKPWTPCEISYFTDSQSI